MKPTFPGAAPQDGMLVASVPNLVVMPVVRYRLSFAERAARMMPADWQGVSVVTDLPRFLQGSAWLKTAIDSLPLPCNILVKSGQDVLSLPISPCDAASVALHMAFARGAHASCYCIDDIMPDGNLPDPEVALADDSDPNVPVGEYFQPLWCRIGCEPVNAATLERAARIAARLRMVAATANLALFICDWRLWPLIESALETSLEGAAPEADRTLDAAIVPEEPLLLWQAGYLDDFPLRTQRSFERILKGNKRKQGHLNRLFRSAFPLKGRTGSRRHPSTRNPATEILDPLLEQRGASSAARMAARLLKYPEWDCSQLLDGRLPRFGTIRAGLLSGPGAPFAIPDVFGTKPFYPRSSAEALAFCSPSELNARLYWGPSSTPPVTRVEAAIAEPVGGRWSVPASYQALADAASLLRNAAQRERPKLGLNLFTPCVWIFSDVTDGDHRSVEDVSAHGRRRRLEDGDGDPAGEVIYTLSATRISTGALCQGVSYDLASTIALLYTGPELGPERYKIVTESGYPFAIASPGEDQEFTPFELHERGVAFAIRYATTAVVVCHYEGFRRSDALETYAGAHHVELVTVPMSELPKRLQKAVQTRIFVAQTTRFSAAAVKLLERAVHWRLPVHESVRTLTRRSD